MEGQSLSLTVVAMRGGRPAEQTNSNDIKDYKEERTEIWTFSVIDDVSVSNQDPKGRKESLSSPSCSFPNGSFNR